MHRPSPEFALFFQQFDAFVLLEFRLKLDEYSGSHEQVCQSADYQSQRSYVLFFEHH